MEKYGSKQANVWMWSTCVVSAWMCWFRNTTEWYGTVALDGWMPGPASSMTKFFWCRVNHACQRCLIRHPRCYYLDTRNFEWFNNGPDHGKQQQQLWLWDVGNDRNELIRGETGWRTFEEREAKSMVKWMLKVVFEENLVSEIGRACLIELRCKSRWWSWCRHICSKSGLFESVNLIWLREVSLNGMVKIRDESECSRIREVGKWCLRCRTILAPNHFGPLYNI